MKLQQSVNVEKEFSHNNREASPSSFNDVEDTALKHENRGAILANIFERHTTSNSHGEKQLLSKNFKALCIQMDIYLSGLGSQDKVLAKKYMMSHLNKRGYKLA